MGSKIKKSMKKYQAAFFPFSIIIGTNFHRIFHFHHVLICIMNRYYNED